MMKKTRRPRIKRDDVIDAFHDHGPCSRAALEKVFKVPAGGTSIQTHITAMREECLIYIREWTPPEKTGMWSPVYDLCTSALEQDAPHPPPRARWRKTLETPTDFDEPIVMRGVGVKKEHALMARTRSSELGLWGDLVRGAQPEAATRAPRLRGAT